MCWDDSPSTTTTTSSNSLPPWVSAAGQDNYAAARTVASRPFTPFSGQRVAGFTDLQNQAKGMAQTGWQPGYEGAMSATKALSDPAAMKQRMNPYVENVLAPILRQLGLQRGQILKGQNAQAHQAGAFGDARAGIQAAETDRNYMQQVSDTTGQTYASAWDKAMQQAQAEYQQYIGLMQANQGAANQMFNVGGQEQAVQQRGFDTNYEQYLREQNWPAEQLNLRIGALSGTPYPVTQASTVQGPGANSAAQNLGAFGLLAGGLGTAYKAFG